MRKHAAKALDHGDRQFAGCRQGSGFGDDGDWRRHARTGREDRNADLPTDQQDNGKHEGKDAATVHQRNPPVLAAQGV